MNATLSRGARALAAAIVVATAFPASVAAAPQGPSSPISVVQAAPVMLVGRRPAATPAMPSLPAAAASAEATTFLDRQLDHARVRRAYDRKAARVSSLFRAAGVAEPAAVFFRVFKREQAFEVWARDRDADRFVLIRTYPVCKLSGRLGPKRRQGDGQIPEGFYAIDLFNPWSSYHLSMRVDYPNPVDRARGARGRLGGDIYIHGGCATIGCVPVGDEWIEEIYLIAVQAREAGQQRVPVHIFPTRLDDAGMRWLGHSYGPEFVDYPFWQNLRDGYHAFESTRRVPAVGYDAGRYTFPSPEAAPGRPAVAAGS